MVVSMALSTGSRCIPLINGVLQLDAGFELLLIGSLNSWRMHAITGWCSNPLESFCESDATCMMYSDEALQVMIDTDHMNEAGCASMRRELKVRQQPGYCNLVNEVMEATREKEGDCKTVRFMAMPKRDGIEAEVM